MIFKSYNDIENSYNEKVIREIRSYGYDNPDIVYGCFTKIDGSNFQCSIDENDNFVVGTRTRFLGRGDDFQGYERAMRSEDVENKLRKMKEYIRTHITAVYDYYKPFEDGEQFVLTVYGELCGGMYRHPDVEKVNKAQRIQGRISYHPDNKWVPFDIVISSRENVSDGSWRYYLDCDKVKFLCDMFDLPCQIEKFRGTFDQCLNYQNDFIDDTGHILWGLPVIEDNITEGVVIKPIKGLWFRNHDRVVLKNKNDKFKEKMNKGHSKTVKEIVPLTEFEKKYFDILQQYITESRLYSVISKVGTVTEKSFGMIAGLFTKDALDDFKKEYEDQIKELEQQTDVDQFNFKNVQREFSKMCVEFIRPTFVKMLNS